MGAIKEYEAWTCPTLDRAGQVCGGFLGDVRDGVLIIGGREVIAGIVRCPVCKRTSEWHRQRPKRKAKVDNNMRADVQYQ